MITSKIILGSKTNICKFVIKGKNEDMTCGYANTLRRQLLEETPYIALTNIKFLKNNTIFNNEYLNTRISMIPLSFPKGKVIFKDNKYQWKDEQPIFNGEMNNTNNSIQEFTSKELVNNDEASQYIKEDILFNESWETSGYTTIAKLQKNEIFKISVKPTIALPTSNSVYSPVGTIEYDPLYNDNDKYDGQITLTIEMNAKAPPSAQQYLFDALYWLEHRLLNINKINHTPSKNKIKEVVFTDITHTLCSLIKIELRKILKDKYVAYKIPHPLNKKIIFHIESTDPIKMIKKAIANAIKIVNKLKSTINIINPTINKIVKSTETELIKDVSKFKYLLNTFYPNSAKKNYNKIRNQLQLTTDSIYSITKQKHKKILKILLDEIENKNEKSIFEGFANVGSDTSYLAIFFKHVYSVEYDHVNFNALDHNVKILNLQNVSIYEGDMARYIDRPVQNILDSSCVYFDPPWLRKNEDPLNWEILTEDRPLIISDQTIEELIDLLPNNINYVLIKLPYNYSDKYFNKIEKYTKIKEIKDTDRVLFRLLKRNDY